MNFVPFTIVSNLYIPQYARFLKYKIHMINFNWKLILFIVLGLAVLVTSSDVSTGSNQTSSDTQASTNSSTKPELTLAIGLANNFNLQYSGQVTIGSNARVSNLIFDTGFPWVWVSEVTIPTVDQITTSGSSPLITNRTQTEFFGRHEMVKGALYADTLTIGQKSMNIGQTFLVSQNSDIIANVDFDGVCGLSLSTDHGQSTLLENLKKNGIINKKVFGLYLSDNPEAFGEDGSEIMFGGNNSNLYTGDFQSINVLDSNYWQVSLTNISLDSDDTFTSKISVNASTAVIASGVNQILMSQEDFIGFNDALKRYNITCYYDSTQNFVCPCLEGNISMFPDLVLFLDSKPFRIPASMYLDVKESGCVVLVEGTLGSSDSTVYFSEEFEKNNNRLLEDNSSNNTSNSTNTTDSSSSNNTQGSNKITTLEKGTYIVLGGVFLRNFYTVFDAENGKISMANAVKLSKRLITMLEVVYLVFGSFILVMFVVFVICFIRIWTTKKVPMTERASLEKPFVDKRTASSQFMQVLDTN